MPRSQIVDRSGNYLLPTDKKQRDDVNDIIWKLKTGLAAAGADPKYEAITGYLDRYLTALISKSSVADYLSDEFGNPVDRRPLIDSAANSGDSPDASSGETTAADEAKASGSDGSRGARAGAR